ncbi:histidine kinase [bacterium]|nr:histidine kinase [bacterium]
MHDMNSKITTFWRIQICGWGLYGLLYFVHMILFREIRPMDVFRVILVIITGFLISCGMRQVYRRLASRSQSILVLSLTTLGCSFVAANIWVWGFQMLWGTIAYGWPDWNKMLRDHAVTKMIVTVFFNTVLLTSWSALYFTIKFWRAWNDQKERARMAREQTQKAQLQMIHYQLNPHFLFNALNAIRALIGENRQNAKQMITELSEFLRYSLISKDQSVVPLHYELEAIRHYFSIEKRRYEDKLKVHYDVDPVTESCPVISFLLYPLAENAIKYGLKTSALPLRIRLRTEMRGSTLYVEIANTGRWITPANGRENGLTHGLSMVRKHLDSLYPENFSLTTGEKDGWVTVHIEIHKIVKPVHEETVQCADRR